MQRYKCTISYDGTLFSGFQIQPKERTVQSELEKALKKIHKGTTVKVVASGRTDAGVHAKGQVHSFRFPAFHFGGKLANCTSNQITAEILLFIKWRRRQLRSISGLMRVEKSIDILSEEHSLTIRLPAIINITIATHSILIKCARQSLIYWVHMTLQVFVP